MRQVNHTDGLARGTRQDSGALRGTVLLQSVNEWEARNRELSESLRALLRCYLIQSTGCGLDVGCMAGELTDCFAEGLGLRWWGVDPDIVEPSWSKGGAELLPGYGHRLAFEAEYFDCVTFANVYEHVPPALRRGTLADIHRVLAPGGILVGQLPNPHFPIESHSRLPFLGMLPRNLQKQYWKLTPTGWDFEKANFFSVTISELRRRAVEVGFEVVDIHHFNYSPAAIPQRLRWAARLHSRLGIVPWSWQFVFRKSIKGRGEAVSE